MTFYYINMASQEATKHFAWKPTKTNNGRVWLKPYYKLWNRFVISADGGRCCDGVISEQEYLVKILRDEIHFPEPVGRGFEM